LPGSTEVDIAIVGAGYTGLWTAYTLRQRDPSLRIAVIEREIAGYGASGRNGGWASALFPTAWQRIARDSSREGAIRLQNALSNSVDELGRFGEREDVDFAFSKGGYVSAARNAAQLARSRAEVDHARLWGFGDDFIRLLGADEARQRLQASHTLGGTYTPHCAAIDPTRLVRGLADVVEHSGTAIYEKTAALSVEPGIVRTPYGDVRAEVVVRATEGYTPDLPGFHRDVIPMYSLMVATEPLSDQVWDSIGLSSRETFSDKRHLRIYGQRTRDGRIAFGGRGAPYHFGSKIAPEYDRDARVHRMLRHILVELFPALRGTSFTHAWGGNLGIPRDWYPSVRFDRRTGFASTGGYVGDGVATANLAGRTLADLITGTKSELVDLPWVDRQSRRWEAEPTRWLGVNAVTALMAVGDRTEARTGKPSRSVAAFWKTLGF
jgi:glycine/D-amino acid oxidase-like deaminating enzyme